jgi:hypothetical protein
MDGQFALKVEKAAAEAHKGPVGGLAYGPGSGRVASAGWDRRVAVRAADWSGVDVEETLPSAARRVTFSRDGRWVAITRADGRVTIWEPRREP